MKTMETIQDLIEEAKLRTVFWALFIFAVSYFLTHTSKSMWMNLPIAVLLVSGIRILFNEVDFHWKVRKVVRPSYLAFLEKKQLSVNDSRLSTMPPPAKWKRKIDSPVVEAAIQDFVNKLMQDFVVDLWYSMITPDRDGPELIYAIIMDALGEVSGRVKEINLVELLTRDVVDLVGDHLDLFRRSQSAIGVDVMGTLSSEERDERLKYHLLSTKELHPALMSSESEYKVLQRLMGGILALVLKPRESQCPLVRCIARELLTCLVMQPVMNLATPTYINQLIETIFVAFKDDGLQEAFSGQSSNSEKQTHGDAVSANSGPSGVSSSKRSVVPSNQGSQVTLSQFDHERRVSSDVQDGSLPNTVSDDPFLPRPGDWARILEAATQRRTEVLMPENLENMWAIGRNYKKKLQKNVKTGLQGPGMKIAAISTLPSGDVPEEGKRRKPNSTNHADDKYLMQLASRPEPQSQHGDEGINTLHLSQDLSRRGYPLGDTIANVYSNASSSVAKESTSKLKRSSSASDLTYQPGAKDGYPKGGSHIITDFYGENVTLSSDIPRFKKSSDMVLRNEASHASKLKCRIVGAYFEKLGSKSFAVYSIAVTDADNHTWFVKRRYSNFERLHRHLKDIPNYTLHLPPKRIFSSSTEDAFVHQRCIQLDKYLQDLLSISNVAEQHDVWDFLSASSKNYSFGKSSSVMRTLAVNVDDAMDDIVRQFKGVSDGLVRKVVGSPSSCEPGASVPSRHLSWNADDSSKGALSSSFSDNDESCKAGIQVPDEVETTGQDTGWHSDTELNSKDFPPRVVKGKDELGNLESEKKLESGSLFKSSSLDRSLDSRSLVLSNRVGDPNGVPPEWTPPNLSVPVLNLVDNIFQLNRRGWLRRQVFWISKQILQLMMEDAIDDWLLRQIHWIRRDDVVAEGIRWLQNVLWPDGTFFLKLNSPVDMDACHPSEILSQSTERIRSKVPRAGSFEQQLESARRASDVKKMLYDSAPTTLVSLIGQKQYRRCARDIYYFLQSTVCLKQLAYGILELVLVSVFPELQDIIVEIHEKAHSQHL